ncbi:hypothetical protein Tco_0404391 [Tanacetum coccineum]
MIMLQVCFLLSVCGIEGTILSKEFLSDDRVDYMDQSSVGLAFQGVLRPSFVEEIYVINIYFPVVKNNWGNEKISNKKGLTEFSHNLGMWRRCGKIRLCVIPGKNVMAQEQYLRAKLLKHKVWLQEWCPTPCHWTTASAHKEETSLRVVVHSEVKFVAYAPVRSVDVKATQMRARWEIVDR